MTDTENQEKPNKEIMDAIHQVKEGGNPEEIAQKVGMPPEQLVALSDSFVQQYSQTSLLGEAAERKIGRNEPCPCGSGKKYKKCCLRKHKKIKDLLRGSVEFQEPDAITKRQSVMPAISSQPIPRMTESMILWPLPT
jgi:hypothetical protein